MSMDLLNLITRAVESPDHQGTASDMGRVAGVAEQLASEPGANAHSIQSLFSSLGSQLRTALQERRTLQGDAAVENVVATHGGFSEDPQAVNAVFTPEQQSQVARNAAQQTGLDAGQIQRWLPVLIPVVLKLIGSGSPQKSGSNPVLGAFLDADGDGDVDMGDTLRLVGNFFGPKA